MISASELSVVVQGPIYADRTAEVLSAVRTHLPEAEIVLSTWIGAGIEGLKPDVLVCNQDPGEVPGRLRNINRQITSTRSGLEQASRPYAMKLRSDTVITNTSFLLRLEGIRKEPRPLVPKVFKQPILICRQFTRDPSRCPLFFHPSDIFMMGRLDDLRQFWDAPLVKLPLTYEPTNARPWFMFESAHLFPEQYIWRWCLAKAGFSSADPDRTIFLLPSVAVLSESSLLANFSLAQAEELGIELPEKLALGPQDAGWYGLSSCYDSTRWHEISRIYAMGKWLFIHGLMICACQLLNRIWLCARIR